uniref:RHS repeat domain-containing protein n=1 Tax=Streptomyces sp. NRRL F-2664 TaxID=1463842 RepID=UPI00131C8406
RYLHTDRRGNTIHETGPDGGTAATRRYTDYGQETRPDGTPATGFRAADPAANPFRFGGEYTNTENGTDYTPARLYHRATGRFTTRDPHPTPLNKYQAYAANPIEHTDPSGNLPFKIRFRALGYKKDAPNFDSARVTARMKPLTSSHFHNSAIQKMQMYMARQKGERAAEEGRPKMGAPKEAAEQLQGFLGAKGMNFETWKGNIILLTKPEHWMTGSLEFRTALEMIYETQDDAAFRMASEIERKAQGGNLSVRKAKPNADLPLIWIDYLLTATYISSARLNSSPRDKYFGLRAAGLGYLESMLIRLQATHRAARQPGPDFLSHGGYLVWAPIVISGFDEPEKIPLTSRPRAASSRW